MPDVPEHTSIDVPDAAVLVRVTLPPLLRVQNKPLGETEVDRVIVPTNPLIPLTVIVELPIVPATATKPVGFAPREKSWMVTDTGGAE